MIEPAAAVRPHNLEQPLSSFVGRAREISDVTRLLETARLVTLTGTGGVGKTRLGHEVSVRLLDGWARAGGAYHDGIWLVQLAALADPLLVPQAMVAVLDVPEEPDHSPTASLIAWLRPKQLLLVLDNCEHLVEPCAMLVDALLRACPGLQILATSRQPLGVAGEMTFGVPSLTLPESAPGCASSSFRRADGLREPRVLGSSAMGPPRPMDEAVQLFIERARDASPAFTLTDSNIGAVEQICRRLDGIPLAIELAAARVAVLCPAQIASRLDDRYRFLTGGSRTALPRYRTLRALIDWSHDLLDERERVLFRRLAVFGSGWTLEAAEAVCAVDGLAPDEILDLLSGLATKSLILPRTSSDACEHVGEMRYSLLESLREYAAEKLRDAGEETMLRQRHRDWLLARAELVEPELLGPRSIWWMDRLESGRDNLRLALAWCIERDEAEPGLRLVSALARFWQIRGPYGEIRAVLADLLALPSASQPATSVRAARANALQAAGMLAMRQGDRDAAQAYYEEALEIGRQIGDRGRQAKALVLIGCAARARGDYPAARRFDNEAIPIFQALGEEFWLARAYHHLGVSSYYEGDLAMARRRYEASLAIFERLGDELGIVTVSEELGEVAFMQGDLDTARSLLRICIEVASRIDDKDRIVMASAALAGLAAAQGRARRALRLAGAVIALDEMTGRRGSPAWHAQVERWLEPARRALPADACRAAEAAGRLTPLDGLIADALESAPADEEPSSGAPALAVAAIAGPDRPTSRLSPVRTALSPRETEVAALIAHGLTNRQIAKALAITEGTAGNHVKHILAKLVLDSRVQIAAWAIRHGLYRRAAS